MSEGQIARVYAQALFEAARDAGVVKPVGRELDDFAAALAASGPLRRVLGDPQIERDTKARVVADVTRDGQPLLAAALQLMLERDRFAVVPRLCEAYEALAVDEEGVVEVEVVAAVELPAETEKRIAARVGEATGRQVELAVRVDPSILGGLVLRIGDTIVDGSVKARIRQLRRRLATAEVRGDVQ